MPWVAEVLRHPQSHRPKISFVEWRRERRMLSAGPQVVILQEDVKSDQGPISS
jgi:hypothetical protein